MDIWHISRTNTIFFPQLPPPKGLNEMEYCKIVMIEKGCQFCSEKSHNVRIYWIFRVRSCWDCLMMRVEYIQQGQSIPDFTTGLPFETFRMHGMFGPEYKVFWKEDYRLAEIEFSKVKENYRANWLKEKSLECEFLMKDALKRGKFYQDSKEIHNQAKLNIIKSFCYQLDSSLTSELSIYNNNNSKPIYNPYILSLCPTFNETISLPNHLFAQVTFKSWKDKMIQDYRQIEMKYSIPLRYNQIYQKLLRTRLFFGLQHWIVHCETYLSPPYINNDPRISWCEEFLDKYIIPKILIEAIDCEKKANDAKIALRLIENLIFQKVINLKTAIEFGLGGDDNKLEYEINNNVNQEISKNYNCNNINNINNGLEVFRCKICIENTSHYLLYSYRGVKKHLQKRHSSFHELIEKDLDDYIELDYKITRNYFKVYSDKWFKTGNYPYKLPDEIMQILKNHRMPWWKNLH
ncbi:hypothetical protein C1645_735523 [Glomus cerebriforme]|uniref:Uncharacterized protein n=1 Tax=Glomus cerebriforme TaxID=658196 RepID=A0A397TB59_9GLOM|nr:hypothetical protein C1645_735523 [Glomus cerebriforme]